MNIKELIQKITPVAKSNPDENVHQLITQECGENAAILLLAMFEGIRVHGGEVCRINGYGDVPINAKGVLSILCLLDNLGVTSIETLGERTANYPFVRPRDRR